MGKRSIKSRFLIIAILIFALVLGVGCVRAPNVSLSLPVTGQYQSAPPAPDTPTNTPSVVSNIVIKIRPSVVAINAELATCDIFGRPATQQVAGSGWILDSNGLIVTNNHVVEGARIVTVTLENGQTYNAKSIQTDPIADLALIDIGIGNLPAVVMGDSSKISVGNRVIAIGNALGEEIRATQGIITSVHSTFTPDNKKTLYDMLETTVPITYGNSGGPLVNMDGEVIGIATAAQLTPTGSELISYAISSNTARPIIQQLTQDGYVTRAWLGANVSSVSELSTAGYKLPVDQGAFIVQVAAGSPAEKSGLKAGDVIVDFGGQDITSADELVETVRSSEIGQQVNIIYWRDNTENANVATLVQGPIS